MVKKPMYPGPIVPSLHQHIDWGRLVKDLRFYLTAHGPLMKGMPHRLVFARTVEALDDLRRSTDDLACRRVPAALDPDKLVRRIYYGKQLTDDELEAVLDIAERVDDR